MVEALKEGPNLGVLLDLVEAEQDVPTELAQDLSSAMVAFARVMEYQGAIGSNIRLCERAARWLRGRPGEANTLKALGDLYVRTDRLREAEEAVLLEPESVLGWMRLGSCALAAGDGEKAKRAYRKVLELEPDNPEVRAFMKRQGW